MNNFWKHLSQSSLVSKWLDTPAPRWTVFMVDILIVALSCFLTFYANDIDGEDTTSQTFTSFEKSCIIVCFYSLSSLIIKSYKYILRLSVIVDMYRIVMVISLASIGLIISSLTTQSLSQQLIIRPWNIFLIAVFSFSMMMCLRLGLKYIYAMFNNARSSRERVIMLGSAINSYFLASALKHETDGHFDPVALISLSGKETDKSINGITIIKYDENTLDKIFEQYKCSTLVFLSTQLEFLRSGAADWFLTHNIKLLMLNQIEEFDTAKGAHPSLSTHIQNIKIEDLLGRETINTKSPTIQRSITGSVVMITGAAGSIGSEIVRQVARFEAKEIVLIDQAETPMHELQLEMREHFPSTKIHLFMGDVTNSYRMEEAFKKYRPRFVFHAAAYKHVPMMESNPSEAVMTNVFGTKNIADLSTKYSVEKFVMISTDKAVNPTNIMGASKRIAEIYVQSLFFRNRKNQDGPTTQFITTRFGNVLGSNGSVIPLFDKQIKNGGPITVTHRDIIRYFMTIPEACQLVLEAGCMGSGGEIYIFDMGKPVKIYDLACRMISLAGLKPEIDIKIVETGLRPGEKLFEELLNSKESTTATHHPKIMIAKVRVYDYDNIMSHFKQLKVNLDNGDNHSLVLEMKHIVPEYVSNNSIWETIDAEVKKESVSHNVIEINNA